MTLRPGLAFFPLDDELVVFSEASQSLVGLNTIAASIVRKLQDGLSGAELIAAVASERGAAAGDAADWVASTLDALGSQGLLADGRTPAPLPMDSLEADESHALIQAKMPPLRPFEPKAEGRYRLLGTCALIRYGHRAQKRMVDTVIGHLESGEDTAPTLIIDIPSAPSEDGKHIASNIYCDGKPDAPAKRLSGLGPLVKSALWVHAVNAYDFLLDLHAGVVEKNGSCVLLPAAAGSGKSSLTTALAHSGFGYYSDEVALIERNTFQVSPVPLAICIKSTGWDLMSRYYPELETLPIHRRDDGKLVRYVPPRAANVQKAPGQVRHIFFPRYTKDEATQLTPLSRSGALARLMDQCIAFRLRLDPASVKELVRWIAGIDCYALNFSSLDEAVALVDRTVSSR
ncbi:MAG TPA: hypothetical protein VFI23_11245 [Rhizomicrobium sp.]|nr:hypothetical protein [Rhizomicrobium sp.]